MFCSHCGTRLAEDADICCKCGLPPKAQINASFRNEASALKWIVPIGRSVWAVMSGYFGILSVFSWLVILGVAFLGVIVGWGLKSVVLEIPSELLSIILGMGLFAVICGGLGLRAIAKNPQKFGKGRAWFGIASGAISIICVLALFCAR